MGAPIPRLNLQKHAPEILSVQVATRPESVPVSIQLVLRPGPNKTPGPSFRNLCPPWASRTPSVNAPPPALPLPWLLLIVSLTPFSSTLNLHRSHLRVSPVGTCTRGVSLHRAPHISLAFYLLSGVPGPDPTSPGSLRRPPQGWVGRPPLRSPASPSTGPAPCLPAR